MKTAHSRGQSQDRSLRTCDFSQSQAPGDCSWEKLLGPHWVPGVGGVARHFVRSPHFGSHAGMRANIEDVKVEGGFHVQMPMCEH